MLTWKNAQLKNISSKFNKIYLKAENESFVWYIIDQETLQEKIKVNFF